MIPQGQGGVGGNEYLGNGGTGQFNQSGGTNMTPALYFGGSGSIYNPTLKTGHKGYATYNLSGGLLQTQSITTYFGATLANCAFNFTGGTLQMAPYAGVNGISIGMPITVGTAASNLATVDANGRAMDIGGFSGPGQLTVIDSAGGGMVVFGGTGNSTNNYYSGGTTVLSGTLEVVGARNCPASAF